MKTNNQIEVIVFTSAPGENAKFLMLKRVAEKGGFWQPITGNVKPHESFEQAAYRELEEETGIHQLVRLFDTGFQFAFHDDHRDQTEKVFAAEVSPGCQVRLSREHTEFAWVTADDALANYLEYPGNKEGLRVLCRNLANEIGAQ